MRAETPPASSAARILVVDDEPQLRDVLNTALGKVGHSATCVADGPDALARLATDPFELVVLDLNLPDIDGIEVLRRLRLFSEVPVIVLSSRQAPSDKVLLLGLGADDYLEKPFTIGELTARIDAVLRRTRAVAHPQPVLSFGELDVDIARHLVILNGTPVRLTKTEHRLLETLVTHPRAVLTHDVLLRTVWGPGYGEEHEYLRTFMAQLRQKLDDDASDPRWIETVPRVGYRWLVEPLPASPPAPESP